MDAALADTRPQGRFSHLSAADRTAIRAILVATKPGAPASWQEKR
jgi:hypothetical protein